MKRNNFPSIINASEIVFSADTNQGFIHVLFNGNFFYDEDYIFINEDPNLLTKPFYIPREEDRVKRKAIEELTISKDLFKKEDIKVRAEIDYRYPMPIRLIAKEGQLLITNELPF